MSSILSDITTGKPSKALNLVYLLFGYVLASYITAQIEIAFEQKLATALIVGGVFGSFLYYTKPVERLIILILHVSGRDKLSVVKSSGHAVYVRKSQVSNSPLLAEERATINGAVFFSLSLLLSNRLLEIVGISLPFALLVAASVFMGLIAVWEIYIYASYKLRIVGWYYLSFKLEKDFPDLKEAIVKKDWLEATGLLSQSLWLGSIYSSAGSICKKCQKIYPIGTYCPDCGAPLLTDCNNCKAALIRKGMSTVPKYCIQCGKAI